jgi:hypothetical protein
MLPFEGGGSCPVQYFVNFAAYEYYVRYRHGILELYRTPLSSSDERLVLHCRIGDTKDGSWNARETNIYVSLLTKSICTERFVGDDYPSKKQVRDHPLYRLGPLPEYPVGLMCGVVERSPRPEKSRMNRHDRKKRRQQGIHDHDLQCRAVASAKDIEQWIVDHPIEHEALKTVYPELWREVARDLEIES